MRRHAKAPSAGSTSSKAGRLGSFRRVLAPGIDAAGANGSGASATISPGSLRVLLAVAALLAFLALPSSAFAAKSVERVIETGPTPGALAVNHTSGNLYVQNRTADRIQVYDDAGNFVEQFGATGTGPGEFSFGGTGAGSELRTANSALAIDQGDGSLYVADPLNNRIQKLAADGTFIAMWGNGVNQTTSGDICTAISGDTCGPGAIGSGEGEFSNPRGVAVNPSTANVYVADTGNNRVQRFGPTGTFQMQFSEGLFEPIQIAVDSTGQMYTRSASFFSPVLRFTSTGAFDKQVTSNDKNDIVFADFVSVDPVTNHIFVSGLINFHDEEGFLKSKDAAYELGLDTAIVDAHTVGFQFLSFGFAGGGDPLYAVRDLENSFDDRVLVLTNAGPPTPALTIEPASDVGTREATFRGTVNPNGGLPSNWRFEYSTDGSKWSASSGGQVPVGTSPVSVEATVENLEPSLEYRVRLTATPELGSQASTSAEVTFTTEGEAPEVEPLYAGVPTDTRAWLGAKVNPLNDPTTFYVEYATDATDLGSADSVKVPASEDAPAGSGGDLVLANRLVTGLQPSTTYHFRVIATNSAGITLGEVRSFKTLTSAPFDAGLPDDRVWEKVSPDEKQGANVYRGNIGGLPVVARAQAATRRSAVAYASGGKFGGNSGPPFSQYLARRGPEGWSTEGINPFHDPRFGLANFNFFEWFSSDLSKGIVSSAAALNPGDPTGLQNMYLTDLGSDSYLTVSNGDGSTPKSAVFRLRATSVNGEHIAFEDQNNTDELYEWTASEGARAVGVFPDGTPMEGAIRIGNGNRLHEAAGLNPLSSDGSRLFFSLSTNGSLYMRENGTSTMLVSASERTGDGPTVPRLGTFFAASKDGRIAFFHSSQELTDDSSGGGIYRWDADAPAGERLTALNASGLSATGIGDDGRSFYFVGSNPRFGLYVWREGEDLQLIGTLNPGADDGLWTEFLEFNELRGEKTSYRAARVTPDGRFIAFSTTETLTAYDTAGTSQIYLYDSVADDLTCASCGTFQVKSKDHSYVAGCLDEPNGGSCDARGEYLTRNLSEDGERLFFDSADALVPRDTNGVTDVYEWSEGRLHLLSSGTSSAYSSFFDASADGDDVFFTTAQQLVPSDRDDLFDLYDARVGGRSEPSVGVTCVADECQGTPAPPPPFQTPASLAFRGEGNAQEKSQRCAKGKVRRKGRCASRKAKTKKQRQKSNRANSNRGAGR